MTLLAQPLASALIHALVLALPSQERTLEFDKLYVSMGYPLFGSVVVSIGDVNHDGCRDFVIVDPAFEEMPSFQRMLWIVSGSDNKILETKGLDLPLTAGLGMDDLDGDGIGDLVFSSPSGAGTELVAISGKSWSTLWSSVLKGSDLAMAQRIDAPRDLDGDHVADVLVTSRNGSDERWRVSAYSGKTGKTLSISAALPTALFARAEWMGDVDSDGIPDFCVGTLEASGEGTRFRIQSGRTASVIKEWRAEKKPKGARLGLCVASPKDPRPSVTYLGTEDHVAAYEAMTGKVLWDAEVLPGKGEGASTSVLTDLDADGVDDVIVRWLRWDVGRIEARSGKTGKRIWELQGPTGMSDFGSVLALTCDLDKDSVPEILVGCDNGLLHEPGRVQLVSGRTGLPVGGLYRDGKTVKERRTTDIEWR